MTMSSEHSPQTAACLLQPELHTITALRDSTVRAPTEAIKDGSSTRESGFEVSITILFRADFYESFA